MTGAQGCPGVAVDDHHRASKALARQQKGSTMQPTKRPAPLACTTCPHGLTAAKLPPVPEATRLRSERLADEPTPCPYIAAVRESAS